MDTAIMDKVDYKITLNSAREIIQQQREKCQLQDLLMLWMAETLKEVGQTGNYQLLSNNNWQLKLIKKDNRLDKYHKEIGE